MADSRDPEMVLRLLDVLISPHPPQPQQGTETKSQPFLSLLKSNIEKVENIVGNERSYKSIGDDFENIVLPGNYETDDIVWKFTALLLKLFTLLKKYTEQLMEIYRKNQKGAKMGKNLDASAPPMSPDTLSFKQQHTVKTSLQFLVVLGISSNLSPGVGLPLSVRSGFAQWLQDNNTRDIKEGERNVQLMCCTKVLLSCIKLPSLGTLILSKHLGDLLAALCEICYAPKTRTSQSLTTLAKSEHSNRTQTEQTDKCEGSSNPNILRCASPASMVDMVMQHGRVPGVRHDESSTTESGRQGSIEAAAEDGKQTEPTEAPDTGRAYYLAQLNTLLDRVYQPMVVRELLVLQGVPSTQVLRQQAQSQTQKGKSKMMLLKPAPMWLVRVCGRLLSDRLTKPQGVQNVIRGMLEIEDPGESQASAKSLHWKKCEAVARVIATCPQQAHSVENYYKIVAPQVVGLLNIEDKTVAKRFVRVAMTTIREMLSQQPQLTRKLIIDPMLYPVLQCLQNREVPVTPAPLVVLDEKGLSQCVEDVHRLFISGSDPHSSLLTCLQPVIHTLFQLYCFTKTGVAPLRAACEEILQTFLCHSEEGVAEGYLQLFLFGNNKQVQGMPRETDSRTLHHNLQFAAGPAGGAVIITRTMNSEENADLETQCQCIVELLVKLKRDGLAARFFIIMLKKLSEVVSGEVGGEAEETGQGVRGGSESLLEIEDRHEHQVQRVRSSLLVLSLLAAMSDKLGPECFQSPTHILDFVQVTLERGAKVLENTEDEMFGMFESETITMAMGLMTAMMGGAVEIKLEERYEMKKLTPLLQKFSDLHPDPEVKDMATDLRIAIATHGVVMSDALTAAAKQRETNKKKEHNTDKYEEPKIRLKVKEGNPTEQKPLIEVLESKETLQPNAEEIVGKNTQNSTNLSSRHSHAEECVKKSKSKDSKSELDLAIEELCDPLIPVRGHGLIRLRHLVEKKDKETLVKSDMLLKIFCENLDHPDSYIYLAAIQGLAALAECNPREVLTALARQYIGNKDSGLQVVKLSPELRMKIGEVMMKTCRSLGDTLPSYRDLLIDSVLSGARDSDHMVRASAMSNLAEICKLMKFSIGNVVQEVLFCVTSLIKSDPEVEVRKAAALTLTLILQGVGKNALKILESELRDIYRLLKFVRTTERDEIVKNHVQLALEELDTIMRDFLFPKETFTKKISVLDPPDRW